MRYQLTVVRKDKEHNNMPVEDVAKCLTTTRSQVTHTLTKEFIRSDTDRLITGDLDKQTNETSTKK